MFQELTTIVHYRIALRVVCALIFSGLGLVATKTATAQTQIWNWRSETVDAAGKFPSVVVDKHGGVHVSYISEGKGVMYAFRPPGASKWFTISIDSKGGPSNETTAIALDGDGNPRICFTPGPLKYSSFDGHEWKAELIGSNTMPLEYACSIAISSTGRPHIIWYQTHNEDGTLFLHLRHAIKQEDVWLVRTVDFDFETGKWNSIAVDEGGKPHLSYSALSGGELRYASLEGNKWEIDVIDSRNFKDNGSFNRGFGSSLILNRDGNPEISYYNDALLKIARKEGGKWKTEVVDHIMASGGWSGYHSTLLLDSHGAPHICYEDSGAVKHAVWSGEKWQIQLITSGGIKSRWPSMAIDVNDNLYIVYRDTLDGSLKVSIGTPPKPNAKNSGAMKGVQ
jgi:hypothetical protein